MNFIFSVLCYLEACSHILKDLGTSFHFHIQGDHFAHREDFIDSTSDVSTASPILLSAIVYDQSGVKT